VHIKGVIDTIQGANHPDNARIFGLSMTYDGHLIITFSDGVAVIDRELNTSSASFYRFADDEYGSNSIAVDENNGIYVASNSIMHKLVWTGTTLSDEGVVGSLVVPIHPFDTTSYHQGRQGHRIHPNAHGPGISHLSWR
jgi:hypothetical protein